MIIETVVRQHTEEAAFLWLLRDAAVHAPHYSLKDLAELDDRVEAHIDGLRIAGDEGWPFCMEGLQHQEAGEVFAAGVLALEGNQRERLETVYETVEAAPETARGLISAIGWTPQEKLQGKAAGMLGSASPLWRRVGIAACAVHRVDCGEYLTEAVTDPDPALRARALRAAGELGRTDLLPVILRQLQTNDPTSAFWAAWSSVALGDRADGLAALKSFGASASPHAERALQLALRTMSTADSQRWLKGLAQAPEQLRLLITACGITGDPVYLPWLITQMDIPEVARVAGEAFSLITGADIAYEDLEGEWPGGFEAGPNENPEDEDVGMDPDEDLAWPDAGRLDAWWQARQAQFQAGSRYLLGQPVSEQQCRRTLAEGFQRQRLAAALELAVLNPGKPLFETRAPGFRQQNWQSPSP